MRRALLLPLIAVMLFIGGVAHAAWLASGSGFGLSEAGTLPRASQPIANLSNGDAVIEWAQNTTPSVDGYLIARYVSGETTEESIGSDCDEDPVVGATCTEVGVPEGRWQYTVTPKLGNWLGAESARSTELHVPTRGPTNLAAQAVSQTQIDLTWTDNSQIEDGYRIERSADGGSTWTALTPDLPPNSVSFSDTDLSCNTTLHYRVKALSATNGDSADSGTASATTQACAATSMSVTSVSVTQVSSNGTGTSFRWQATFEVTVEDNLGQHVAGASVVGAWSFSGGASAQQGIGSPDCTTGQAGTCSVTRTGMHNNIQWVTWTVEDVTKQGLSYTSPSPKPAATADKPS